MNVNLTLLAALAALVLWALLAFFRPVGSPVVHVLLVVGVLLLTRRVLVGRWKQ